VLLLAPGGDVSAGDTWTLRLDGIDYPYAAQEGDTAASLAAALAALADGADGIVASSESAAIAVESLGGGSLEASLAVSPP
jgi:hypothetical protein